MKTTARNVAKQERLSGTRSTPPWFPRTEKALNGLLALPPNWDSYGANAVQPEIVRAATDLLRTVVQPDTPEPAVVPTARGGVQVEWHTHGIDFEIELTSPQQIQVLFEDADGSAAWEYELGASDLTPIVELVARLAPCS